MLAARIGVVDVVRNIDPVIVNDTGTYATEIVRHVRDGCCEIDGSRTISSYIGGQGSAFVVVLADVLLLRGIKRNGVTA